MPSSARAWASWLLVSSAIPPDDGLAREALAGEVGHQQAGDRRATAATAADGDGDPAPAAAGGRGQGATALVDGAEDGRRAGGVAVLQRPVVVVVDVAGLVLALEVGERA